MEALDEAPATKVPDMLDDGPVRVVVYELVASANGSTHVAPLARSEPYIVVVPLFPSGKMIVACDQPSPITVLSE